MPASVRQADAFLTRSGLHVADGASEYEKTLDALQKALTAESPRADWTERVPPPGTDKPRSSAPQFPYTWLDDAKVDFENNDLVKGVIGREALILVYGPSGDGKTFWTIDLACHIAEGREWRGRRVKQALVVYVAAEAGTSIVRRFVALRGTRSESAERTPLAIITRGANLLDPVDVERLVEALQAISAEADLPIGLVIFDTYSRSMPGGDENGPQDVTQVIAASDRLRDQLHASTLFVHHSGKDETRGARGHTALHAAADTVLNVVERVVTIKKSRDGASGDGFAFNLKVVDLGEDSDGELLTTCIVEHLQDAETPQKPVRIPSGLETFLRSGQEAIQDSGEVVSGRDGTSSIPPNVSVVTEERWRDRFHLRYGGTGDDGARSRRTVDKAFNRNKEKALDTGFIGISAPYMWMARKVQL